MLTSSYLELSISGYVEKEVFTNVEGSEFFA